MLLAADLEPKLQGGKRVAGKTSVGIFGYSRRFRRHIEVLGGTVFVTDKSWKVQERRKW